MSFRDNAYYAVGIGFLALAKAKNLMRGYSTPKPFAISETQKCVEYDMHVVEHWLSHLRTYTRSDTFVVGKNVLELGPGSDLGVGILLLTKGAANYSACDVNPLAMRAPDSFYEAIFERLERVNGRGYTSFVRDELVKARAGAPSRLSYVVRDDFDVAAEFGHDTIDLVFSQAAFEHFDDVNAVVSQLAAVCKPGAVLIAEIDLQTHSRWIRDNDPNNIYRYANTIYRAFSFRGIPNRVRPYQYREAFERCGWTDVVITPLSKIAGHRVSQSTLNKSFMNDINEMEYLSIMLCATRSNDLH